MYLRVADRAGLVLVCLIVERRDTRSREVHGCRMALEAQRIHIVAGQQPGIWRSMREMTARAALGCNHGMRIDEWAGGLGVAFRADCVAAGAGMKRSAGFLQSADECAVRIVAIAACHQPFIDLVVEGLREGPLYVGMAGITKLRLRRLEKVLLRPGAMDGMAALAANRRLSVRRVFKIRMGPCVTAKAFLVRHPG